MKRISKKQLLEIYPFCLAILYLLGFLIVSIRLSSLEIFVYDFFALSYLKTSILFIFINAPIPFVYHFIYKELQPMDKWWYRLLTIIASIFILTSIYWLFLLVIFDFKYNNTNIDKYSIILIYIVFASLTYLFFHKLNWNILKKNPEKIIPLLMLSLGTINAFSNVIYPNIKFAYGGGQPYQKTIEYVDNGRTLNYEKVLIYYENDSWIYFEEDGRVIALPKTSISRIVNESIKN